MTTNNEQLDITKVFSELQAQAMEWKAGRASFRVVRPDGWTWECAVSAPGFVSEDEVEE